MDPAWPARAFQCQHESLKEQKGGGHIREFLNDLAQEEVDNQFLKPKVVGIGGSPRKKEISDVLLRHILNGVRENKSV